MRVTYPERVIHFDSLKMEHGQIASFHQFKKCRGNSSILKAIKCAKELFKLIAYSVAKYALYPIESSVHFLLKKPLIITRQSCNLKTLFQTHFPENKDPFSLYISKQVREDVQELDETVGNAETIRKEIRSFIQSEALFENEPIEKRDLYTERALSVYASSRIHYAPIVLAWAKSALDSAIEKGSSKVLFMARDGTPAYEAAKILQDSYPEKYGNLNLKLFYISRKLAGWAEKSDENKKLYLNFIKQENYFNSEGTDNCLFIDIGFLGSKNQFIKNLLKPYVNQIDFGFLISHTNKAEGFLADLDHPLKALEAAGKNPAAAWIEDTHQGVENSTQALYFDESEQKIKRSIEKEGDPTCKSDHPKSYLYKKFGRQAIIDGVEESLSNNTNASEKKDKENLKGNFDQFLMKMVDFKRFSLVDHF